MSATLKRPLMLVVRTLDTLGRGSASSSALCGGLSFLAAESRCWLGGGSVQRGVGTVSASTDPGNDPPIPARSPRSKTISRRVRCARSPCDAPPSKTAVSEPCVARRTSPGDGGRVRNRTWACQQRRRELCQVGRERMFGKVLITRDAEALVLDPTDREAHAEVLERLGCPVERHAGYRVTAEAIDADFPRPDAGRAGAHARR